MTCYVYHWRYTLVPQLFQEVYARHERAIIIQRRFPRTIYKQTINEERQRGREREEWKRLEELCAAKMLRIIYQFSLGGAKASAYSVGSDSRVFSSRQYNTCARPVSRSTPLPFRVYQNVSNA